MEGRQVVSLVKGLQLNVEPGKQKPINGADHGQDHNLEKTRPKDTKTTRSFARRRHKDH